MEKSHRIIHQENMNPSAPPAYLSQPSIQQQSFIHRTSYPGLHNGAHNQSEYINSGFQSGVEQQPGFVVDTLEPIDTHPTIVPPLHERTETYCERLYTNRRQTGSISGGLLLMLVSGLHIGWGVWRTGWWPIRTNLSLLIFTIMIWPFGAIFGSFIGSVLTPILRKNVIYFITASIMIVGNLLFIIWDDHYASIVFGRLLTSLAHGILFVTLITQAGENAERNMRGTMLSTINCMLYTAIFISVIITGTVQITADGHPVNVSAERILGIIALIFILGSIICTITVTVETVPYLLKKNKPNIATENMKYLRDVASETPKIRREMEELTLMIAQDENDSANIFTNRNTKPLILMIATRLMVSLTNNFLLNVVVIRFCELIVYGRHAPIMIVAPRLAMSVIQIFYADFFGRKTQIIISGALAGLVLIGLGIVINTIDIKIEYYIPAIFCIFFQLFCSIGIDQMADVYLSEAFSTAKKPWSIAFVMGIEYSFHIFMSGMAFINVTSMGQISALIFISGIFVTSFVIILYFTLSETKGATLKQARDLFRNEKIIQSIGSPYA